MLLLVSLRNDVLGYPTTFVQQLAYVALLTPLCAPSAHHRRDICEALHGLFCPLLGVKRTWRGLVTLSANDPKRTMAELTASTPTP